MIITHILNINFALIQIFYCWNFLIDYPYQWLILLFIIYLFFSLLKIVLQHLTLFSNKNLNFSVYE